MLEVIDFTAELMAHRDRVSRHAKALVSDLSEIKTRAERAPDHMMAQVTCELTHDDHM